MTSQGLRQKYLKFFAGKGHKIIPSASLVPKEDVELAGTQRVLFTTAGMHPLVPYLLGRPHPEGKRLVSVQKCLRTDDIDEVGDTVHNTFFEMLGNWSLGDPLSPDGIGKSGYWKEEAIFFSYDFLINELKIDAKRLYVSVFVGDRDAPFDQESFDVWKKLGMPEDHIFRYPKLENWWGPVGPTGPCGPDTEMFYDLAPGSKSPIDPASDPNRYVEIANDVFMEYERHQDGSFKPLKQKNVDTGMGLERMLLALAGAPSIYETDVFLPLMKKIEDLSSAYNDKSARILADHIRASVFLIADGVAPSNLERGYILRRLIRRAIRHASLLKIDSHGRGPWSSDSSLRDNEPEASPTARSRGPRSLEIESDLIGEASFLKDLASIVVKTYGDFYPNLVEFQKSIAEELTYEEAKFQKALASGIRQFEKLEGDISGKVAFDLYQNYGFPIELTVELAAEKEKEVDIPGFFQEFEKHQELSRRAGSKTKGGLAVQSDKAAKLHTATHLLHQALRDVLGHHVHQTGSHITDERLRFDFSHDIKLTYREVKKVEKLVNEKIKANLKVRKKVMPKEAAQELGAIGLFNEKYPDLVNVYFIGPTEKIEEAYSKEFCGGPHSDSTVSLGQFKITKEESAGSGVRRIYATISG
ncbi:alanine--tRNA ligase [Candidatus Curtissbacteria bacterium]|nr:alanine--tRNA ligase [Candidatus Curtissbacteria bacterium]